MGGGGRREGAVLSFPVFYNLAFFLPQSLSGFCNHKFVLCFWESLQESTSAHSYLLRWNSAIDVPTSFYLLMEFRGGEMRRESNRGITSSPLYWLILKTVKSSAHAFSIVWIIIQRGWLVLKIQITVKCSPVLVMAWKGTRNYS